ncbi:MAG: hypothetical protein JO066_13940 [Verrucomicrobia bacterium]|nr:hypothetical protein [Verrucomicrobiota bacterium]
MDTTDPSAHHQTIETHAAVQGDKLDIDPVQPAKIQSPDAHWLRMDASLARAVLAKTEEELLSSLAALMRNKVEHEQASRRFAQIQIDAEEANHELGAIKERIRRAEEEVATRLNEQSRVNEEIVRIRQELTIVREEHQRQIEIVSSIKRETAQAEHALADAHRNLNGLKEAIEIQQATHRELIVQLAHVENEKAALEQTLAPLRSEVDERIRAREALIAETVFLHQHVMRHAAEKEQLDATLTDLRNELAGILAQRQGLQQSFAEEQTRISDLLTLKASLKQEVTADKHRAVLAEIALLERAPSREMAESEEKAEQTRIEEGLPLLFSSENYQIAPGWDPYPLESEFHTDEVLDARRVAELVSLLPGLEGCLVVKNQGAVLASEMSQRIHSHLKVPNRNYHLLFDCLEKKVQEYDLQNARVATFDLGEEALTVAQANHTFLIVNHQQTRLRPGMPDKLAAIVSEVAKMYP